jgi:peptidylamidoglycolate lyase
MKTLHRRAFLTGTAAALAFPSILRATQTVGHGQHRYRVVPGWGVLDEKTPVKNGHGMVQDRQGHIYLLTDHTANNVIIYDKAGKLVHKWGTDFPGAHGLSLITEGDKERLFITDLQKHAVVKTTLEGEVLEHWAWPEHNGKYQKAEQYKPSWTLHGKNGDFYVLDGYGKDYIMQYDAKGVLQKTLGGAEGGIVHWGPHGGSMDEVEGGGETLLIAMSDQKHLLRLSLDGKKLEQIDLPGGNPRQVHRFGQYYYIAHLADHWPEDKKSRGFVSILDAQFKVVANIAGTAPVYDTAGRLQPMKHQEDIFMHPHDLLVDAEQSIYVAQFDSGNTYPIKLERV